MKVRIHRLILCLVLLLWQGEASAQNYLLRYVTTASGAITFTGNTLGLAKQAGENLPGTFDSIGAFITLNTNSQAATFPPGTTFNWTNDSSAALLNMPTNSTVLYAELVWSGCAQLTGNTTPTGDVLPYVNTPVTFILPNGSTNIISPDPATAAEPTITNAAIFYVRSANVTALVQAAGAGYYACGGVPGTILASEDNNNTCGWTLAVVYGNSSLHQRNLSLFVGNSIAIVNQPQPQPAAVNGFCTPPTGPVNARLYVSAMEGDPNKTGDQMLFGTVTNNLSVLSGPNNAPDNFFASQINDDNGLLDTNGTFGLSNSVPSTFSVAFCARQGWDITSVDVSSGLTNGAENAYAQNITSNDGYTVNALGLQIDVGSPVLNSVQSVDKASTFVSDTLTYTVTVTNSGTADAVNLIFTDPLPFGTSFITNTFATNGVVIPGADPQLGVFVPLIQQSNSITFTYKVVVNQIPPSAKFITAATINFQSTGPCAESSIINSTIVNLNVETLAPLLNLTKTATLTNVVPGGIMTYTISIPNQGTTNDYDCYLEDPLPAGISYIPGTTELNGSSVSDISGGIMPYSVKTSINGPGSPVGEIDTGVVAKVTFQVQIATNPPAFINNEATFYDPGPPQNVSSVIPPIYADLAVGITGNPDPVPAGSTLSYTITVTNLGPNSATTLYNYVTLSLPLSPYLLSPAYTPAEGVFDPSNGVWSGVNLPSNGVISMIISGEVSPSITATNIISSVTVSPPLGIIDPFLSNNSATNSDPVADIADLAVAISDGVTNVFPGETLTYTITAINYGPSTLNTITLSNTITPFLQNISLYPNEGTYNDFNGVWNGLNLAAGGSVTMTLVGTVPANSAGASFSNSVAGFVPVGYTDPVLTNNYAIDFNTVIGAPIVSVFKTGPANVYAGTNYSYTLTITNSGVGAVSNVVVGDILPAGVSFVSAGSGGTNNNPNGQVTWSFPSLAAANGTNFTVTVTASSAGNMTVTNIATMTGTGPGTNVVTNTSPPVVTVIVPEADLALAKTAQATAQAGANFNYTLTVTNNGPSTATNVSVVDPLPTGLTLVSASGGGATNTQGQVVWPNLGSLAANSVFDLTMTVQVGPNVSGSLTNLASVSSPTPDPTPINNTNPPTITTITPEADLALIKTAQAAATAGSSFNYTLTVTNNGPSTATNVSVVDPLPAGLTLVSASGGGATNTQDQVVWSNLGALAANSVFTLTMTVQVGGNVSGSLTNLASVSSPTPDPTPINNTNPPVVTTITPEANLVLTKIAQTNMVTAGSTFGYLLTVTNNGPSTATNLSVTDPLPTGLTLVSASNGGATNTQGQVVWPNLGTLQASNGFALTLTVQVGGNVTSLTNVASVYSPIPDPNPPSRTNSPSIIPVIPEANLVLTKIAQTNTVTAGSTFGYLLTVTNNGPSTATNLSVTDPLPAGLTMVSASNGGATNTQGQVVWPNLGSLPASNGFALTLTVQVAGNVSSLTNVASVYSPIPDPNPPSRTNSPSIIPVIPEANLVLTKVAQTNIVTAGGTFNYLLTLTNNGPSTATNISVTDPLPAGLTVVSASNGGATNTQGQVVWPNLGNLPASSGLALTLTVQVSGNVTGLTNVASVYSPIPDPNPPSRTNPPAINPVVSEADLGLTKTAQAVAQAGSSFNYTLTVTNNGPSTATNVSVTDPLPAGLILVSASNGGATNTQGQVIWPNLGTLTANNVFSLTMTVQVGANVSGSLTNLASVSSPTPDPTPINNTNPPVVTTVTPEADLALTKTAQTNAVAGSDFNYTLTVTNNGPSTATNVAVIDPLPAGLTLVSASNGGVTNTQGQVVWPNLGTLAANSVFNLTMTVQVGGNASGSLTNVASVSSPTPDPTPINNTNPPVITTITPEADLALAKTAQTNAVAGSDFNYTLTVTNNGPSTATNVAVIDPLPAGLTLVSASNGGVTNTQGQVVWPNLGALAANNIINLTMTVQVGGNVSGLTNVASVNSPTPDPMPINNTNPPVITTVTPEADLALAKSAQTNAVAGADFNYTLTVTNNGPSAATNVAVIDPLPAGLTLVSASNGGATNTQGQVVWPNLGALAANNIINLTMTVQVGANVTGLTNVASVSSPTPDPMPINNTNPPVITTVTPEADLALTKTAQASAPAGSSFNYTLTVTNNGPSTATNVAVIDPLPPGLTLVSASNGGATNTQGQVIWPNLGALAASGTFNLTMTVQVAGNVSGITNVAVVNSPTPDPTPINNTNPPVITTITPVADVGVNLTGPGSVQAGSNFTYTVTITNAGPSTAGGVIVTDGLPVNVVFVSVTGGGSTNLVGQLIWPVISLPAGGVTNFILTVTAPASGSITNFAEGTGTTYDPDLTNNTSADVITLVTPVADVGVTKSGPASVLTGANFNYGITVTNYGPSTAGSVTVTDTLPAGVVFVSASGGGGTNALGQVIWAGLGNINASTGTNLTLTVLENGNVTSLTNVATVGSPTSDPNPTNNVSAPVITTVIAEADLGLTKVAQSSVLPGAYFNYSLTVTNNGPAAAADVSVIDPLPAGLTLVAASGSGTTNTQGQVVWPNLGTLAANSVFNLSMTVQVGANASGSLTNVASVDSPTPDPIPTNNTNPPVITTIISEADLALTKTAQTNVLAGTAFNYSLTVTNYGPAAATNVAVVDPLPAGLTLVSASNGGATNTQGQVVWPNLGSLAANNGLNLTMTVLVGGNVTGLTNVASVTSPTPDPTPINNTNPPVITTVTPEADLGLTKTGPTNVVAGADFNYYITVTNNGPSAATNVSVTDPLPAGLTFISATSGGATNTQGQVVWPNLGALAANTAISLTLTVQVGNNVTGLTNVASVYSPTPDPIPGNNTNPPVIIPVTPEADLGLSKTGPANVIAGANFNYYITVTNNGPSAATNVSVTDPLPAGLTLVSASNGGATNTQGQVIWPNLGTLPANNALSLTLTVQVGNNVTGLTNVASVYSPTPDPIPGNNTNPPVIIPVTPEADLGLTKTGPANIAAGANFNYYITVTNYGPSSATNVTVTDPLPAGLTLVSASNGGATNTQGQVIWPNLGTLPANNALNLTLTVQVGNNVTGLTNVASVYSPTPDPIPGNNTNPPVIIPVTPEADLGLTKTAQANVVAAGSSFNYYITVTNYGPSSATNVTVTDPLPAGLTLVSASNGGATNTQGQVIWPNLGTLPANNAFNLTLTVQVNGNATGLTNVASVYSPTPDPVPGNNTNPPVIVPVTPEADLGLSKTAQASVLAGNTFNYYITVTNYGPSSATNVTVTDPLPAGLTLVGTTGGGATNTQGQVIWPNLGTLPANTAFNLTLTVQVNGSVTGLTNVASVYSPTPDPIPGNNTNPPVIIPVTPEADLGLTKTAQTNVVAAGSSFSYYLTVTNYGPSSATNVSVTDPLPAGLAMVSASNGGATNTQGQVVWPNLGTLAANTAFNLTLTVQAGGNVAGLTNVASVYSPTPDPIPGNNTNPPVILPVTPVADVIVLVTGPASGTVGNNITYTITVTNAGPSTASNVVSFDWLPAGAAYVSSGGGTLSSNVVYWPVLGSLAAGGVATYTLTVDPQSGGVITDIAAASSSTYDPNLANNNGSAAASQWQTTVANIAAADVFVLLSGPTNVPVGTNFTYTIAVTNSGPNAASNIVVYDSLPSAVDYVSATGGGGLTNGLYTWPKIPLLTAGAGTNYTLTVYAPAVINFTNVAYSTATSFDPDLANNNGSLPASQAVTSATQPYLIPQNLSVLINSNNLNAQSSLYEELVVVTNIGTATATAVRLTVAGLPSYVTLYNASGTNAGVPYVQDNFPLPPGGTVDFVLEFYNSLRKPFTNIVSAFVALPAAQPVLPTSAVSVPITEIFQSHINLSGNVQLSDTSLYVIEFPTVIGHTYTILYTDSLSPAVWYVVTPYITATATAIQWDDDGPPKTESLPSFVNTRFYRAVEVK